MRGGAAINRSLASRRPGYRARLAAISVVAAWALLLAPTTLVAAESITVHLASGRSVTGAVDAQTDAEQLWLRTGTSTMIVRRPIDWDRVVGAQWGDTWLAGDELQRHIGDLVSSAPDGVSDSSAPGPRGAAPAPLPEAAPSPVPAPNPMPAPNPVPAPSPVPTPAAPAAFWSSATPHRHAAAPNLAWLDVDARVVNFNRSRPTDGLRVWIAPRAADGSIRAVDGTLQVRLWGLPVRRMRSAGEVIEIGRWSVPLHAAERRTDGYHLTLPFRGRHPEFDTTIAAYGTLDARLVVPGAGVFEADVPMLRVRPYSAVRDRLQLETGRRHFLHETPVAGW